MGIENALSKQLQSLGNLHATAVKKYLQEILKERYVRHQDIAERLAAAIVTQRDLQEFGNLVSDVYEVGFLRAVDEYRRLLKDAGMSGDVKITEPPPPVAEESIFTPKNRGRRPTGRS